MNEQRKSRTLLQLVQEPPKHSMFLHADVVAVTTSEAKRIVASKAKVLVTYTSQDGRRLQLYLYGMKIYAWIAGITTDSKKDDFPSPPEKQRHATEIPMNPA